MKITFRKNIFVLFAIIGGAIVVAMTLFLIAALHLVKLFFGLFIVRKQRPSKFSKTYQYSEDVQQSKQDSSRRVTKTIDAEVVTAETKTLDS